MEKLTPKEAKEWIKQHWGGLVNQGKLGEALKRYYEMVGKTAGQAWEEIKEEIIPK